MTRALDEMDEGDLIASIERLIALVGAEAVNALSAAFGGRRLYIPESPGAHHPLSVAVGLEAATILAQRFHGQNLDIPITPARRSLIIDLDKKKWTRAAIAKKVQLTERRVYQVLEEARAAAPRPAPKGTLL